MDSNKQRVEMSKQLYKPIKIFYFFLSFINFSSFGQTAIGNWFTGINQMRLHDNWSTYGEVQYRSFKIIPNTEQLILRAGINYHINPQAYTTVGYGYITNYAYDKVEFPGLQNFENRIWEQFVIRSHLGRCLFEHRYRLEQRWIHSNSNKRYLDRIRYMLRITIPVNTKTIETSTLFISFYNELFVHFTPTPFDRNRLYGAIGYQFSPSTAIQLGYLMQTVNVSTKQYLQAAVSFNLDFRKKE